MPNSFARPVVGLLLVAGAASIPSISNAIVIRHDIPDAAYLANESDFPALFGIYRTKPGYKDCIATVINARWAATAAHCARDKRLLEDTSASGKGYAVEVAGKPMSIDRVIHRRLRPL